MSIYLTDDGSTDGTSEAVSKNFPHVKILKGDGMDEQNASEMLY